VNILEIEEDRGYPTEYLLSRIRGRRVYLIKDWNTFLFSPTPLETLLGTHYRDLVTEYSKEGVWKAMLKEFKWAYLQMNKGLRNVFSPFFLYSEIKTIILCLRHKMEKDRKTDVEDILSFSLLSGDLKEVFRKDADLPFLLEEIERQFLPLSDNPEGLNVIFSKKGLKGVEEQLTDSLIEQIRTLSLHAVIKKYFVFLIDMRNVITLYKYVRWSVVNETVFVQGGSIQRSLLKDAAQRGDLSQVRRLIFELTGIMVEESGLSGVENVMLASLTKRLRILAKESYDIGLILDYLWKIYVEARNLAIILSCGDMERVTLKKELVIE
jgi:vacuolar-type H+-ATPase subunit C/Vma6